MILHDKLKAMLALRCMILEMSSEQHDEALEKYGYGSPDELDMCIVDEVVFKSGIATADLEQYEPILPMARKS